MQAGPVAGSKTSNEASDVQAMSDERQIWLGCQPGLQISHLKMSLKDTINTFLPDLDAFYEFMLR